MSQEISETCMQKITCYLNFKFNWASCILPGNISWLGICPQPCPSTNVAVSDPGGCLGIRKKILQEGKTTVFQPRLCVNLGTSPSLVYKMRVQNLWLRMFSATVSHSASVTHSTLSNGPGIPAPGSLYSLLNSPARWLTS